MPKFSRQKRKEGWEMRKKHRERIFAACLLVHGSPEKGRLIDEGQLGKYDEDVMNWYKSVVGSVTPPKRQTCYKFLREFVKWYRQGQKDLAEGSS